MISVNREKRTIINITEAFLCVWALSKMAGIGVGNILSFLLLGFVLLLFEFVRRRENAVNNLPDGEKPAEQCANKVKRYRRISYIPALIFSMILILADKDIYVASLSNRMFKAVVLAVVFAGMTVLFSKAVRAAFYVFDMVQIQDTEQKTSKAKRILLTALLCFVCYMPYFLYEFPGIMTPDSVNQLEQAAGLIGYSNHHPWVHTLIIKAFYLLGTGIFKTPVAGVALYTLFQMTVMSLCAGFTVDTLALFGIKKNVLMAVSLFYAIVPYNAVFAVTMWKDVLFGCTVMIFILTLLRILLKPDTVSIILTVSLALSGTLICLLRSNGWYAFLVTAPVLIFIFIKRRLRIQAGALLLSLVLAVLVKWPIMNTFGVTSPDFTESLSVPASQVAAVIVNKGNIDEADMELISKVVDLSYIDELYCAYYADNIKELIRAGHPEYLVNHKGDFLKMYMKVGLKNPLDYINAYVNLTDGYYYPDVMCEVANTDGISPNSFGLAQTPLIKGLLVVKAKEIWIKLGGMLPLYGVIWSVGSLFWLMLLGLFYIIAGKIKDVWMIYIPLLFLNLSVMVATPVNGDFRYVYYLVLALPLLLCLPLTKGRSNDEL